MIQINFRFSRKFKQRIWVPHEHVELVFSDHHGRITASCERVGCKKKDGEGAELEEIGAPEIRPEGHGPRFFVGHKGQWCLETQAAAGRGRQRQQQ